MRLPGLRLRNGRAETLGRRRCLTQCALPRKSGRRRFRRSSFLSRGSSGPGWEGHWWSGVALRRLSWVQLRVVVDMYERESRVRDALQVLGVETTIQRLPVAAYEVGGALVERKSVRDLHLSIIQSRVW